MTDQPDDTEAGAGPMGGSTARVEWLTVAGDAQRWRDLGLVVTGDGLIPLMGTSLRIVEPRLDGEAGIVGWALSGIDASISSIEGLATEVVASGAPVHAHHDLGALDLDHVVVMTSDLEVTSAAIAEATGCELKRIREAGPVRQGFHRIGSGGLIVEVVQHRDDQRAVPAFWGLVINVDDIDAACVLLGEDRIGAPKDAVQPGRRIATVRSGVGLGVPVALMSR